jgi:hypothetical protein
VGVVADKKTIIAEKPRSHTVPQAFQERNNST